MPAVPATDTNQHPHLSPADTWKHLFDATSDPEQKALQEEARGQHALFTPSQEPGHKEILRLLRENEPDTVTIAAIGPLTNLAIAAAEDPETFLRAKEVVVMGGNVFVPGNVSITPDLMMETKDNLSALFSPRQSITKAFEDTH
jgi:inosine-uridine nucleoside N-ribohydrolase